MARKNNDGKLTDTKVTITVSPGNIWAQVERASLSIANAIRKLPPGAYDEIAADIMAQILKIKDTAADQFLLCI